MYTWALYRTREVRECGIEYLRARCFYDIVRLHVVVRLLIIGLASTLVLVPPITTVRNTNPLTVNEAASSTTTPFQYLITIIMENHPLNGSSGLVGSSYAPYLNSLLKNASLAANYHNANSTGSLSQYIGMMSGRSPCADDYVGSPNCTLYDQSVVDRLESSGRTWKAFYEDYNNCNVSYIAGCLPSGCMTSDPGGYLHNHNPFLYYPATLHNASRCSNIVPANSQVIDNFRIGTVPDLFLNHLNQSSGWANFIWLVPNHCDSFHGPFANWTCAPNTCSSTDNLCLLNSQVQIGDDYLHKVVPQILSSNLFKTGKAALFITFDEPNTHPDTPGICPNPEPNTPSPSEHCQILGLWAGPTVKRNYVSNNIYTHYSYLKTIESAWQLFPLTSYDANSAPMTEFFTVPFPAPKASFTNSPANPIAGQSVSFTGSMNGGIPPYNYGWDFGDRTPAPGNTASLSHIYASAGTFNPIVTIADSQGHSDTFSRTVIVTTPITASFDYSPGAIASGTSVQFVSHVSGGAGPYKYSWNFGDGRGDSSANPTHSFASPNKYMVKLTVSDSLQHYTSSVRTLNVTSMAASMSYDPAAPRVGDVVNFSVNAQGGVRPYSYLWNFGDGTSNSTTTDKVSHLYKAAGTVGVKIEVDDLSGLSTMVFQTLGIQPLQEAVGIAADPRDPVIGDEVSFTATVSGGTLPFNYSWDFGDGNSAGGASLTHVYSAEGTYIVRVNVTDSSNPTQSKIATRSVSVSRSLCGLAKSCGMTINDATPVAGQLLTFKANADGGVLPYIFQWEFGDGAASSGNTVSHRFVTNGSYTVKLVVIDNAGHRYQTSNRLTVGSQGQSSNLPLGSSFEFLLVAFVGGAIISCAAFLLRHRILRRFQD